MHLFEKDPLYTLLSKPCFQIEPDLSPQNLQAKHDNETIQTKFDMLKGTFKVVTFGRKLFFIENQKITRFIRHYLR